MARKDDIEISDTGIRVVDGVQLDGASQLPHNHRLRAEALVAKGRKTDPDGLIDDELIADTANRIARERTAAQAETAAAKPATARSSKKKPATRKPDAVKAPSEPITTPVDAGSETTEELS